MSSSIANLFATCRRLAAANPLDESYQEALRVVAAALIAGAYTDAQLHSWTV